MKKSTRRSSRRKWVVGGIAFFGSIALLTTGFATWVVGVQQDKQEGDVGVTVETTTNSSIRFEAVLDDNDKAIKLKETEATSNGKILNETSPEPGALDITFKTFKITLGKDAKLPKKITMSIEASEKYNKQNTATTYLFKGHAEESELKYIAAPAEITLTKDSTYTETSDGVSGNKVWEITNKKLTFQWGDYFDNKSPCKYYNSFYDEEEEPTEPTQADIDAVASEMKAMADAFLAQPTIHLTLQLSY